MSESIDLSIFDEQEKGWAFESSQRMIREVGLGSLLIPNVVANCPLTLAYITYYLHFVDVFAIEYRPKISNQLLINLVNNPERYLALRTLAYTSGEFDDSIIKAYCDGELVL